MTITLPDEMRETLEARAKAAGFDRIDDYVEGLTSYAPIGAQDWVDAHRSELLALAEEGLRTQPIENPEHFFNELIRRTASGQSPDSSHTDLTRWD